MQNVLAVYKPIGVTPLQVISKLKEVYPEYAQKKITYAGRLDPLAHGVLILLVDDAIKQKEQFLNLPKTYEFEVLLGIETDTYDMLGLIRNKYCHPRADGDPHIIDSRLRGNDSLINVNNIVNAFVNEHKGKLVQEYPPYSSKTVQGKPLFWWAKQNKLKEIEIPKREIEIYEFELISKDTVIARRNDEAISLSKNKSSLEELVKRNINLISGDFRQKEILESWEKYFLSERGRRHKTFQTLRFRISCSSGTYIRSLAHELGKMLGTGAIAREILRTRVGKYDYKDALNLAIQ